MPARDADAVARLRAAGAIVFGKTNLPLTRRLPDLQPAFRHDEQSVGPRAGRRRVLRRFRGRGGRRADRLGAGQRHRRIDPQPGPLLRSVRTEAVVRHHSDPRAHPGPARLARRDRPGHRRAVGPQCRRPRTWRSTCWPARTRRRRSPGDSSCPRRGRTSLRGTGSRPGWTTTTAPSTRRCCGSSARSWTRWPPPGQSRCRRPAVPAADGRASGRSNSSRPSSRAPTPPEYDVCTSRRHAGPADDSAPVRHARNVTARVRDLGAAREARPSCPRAAPRSSSTMTYCCARSRRPRPSRTTTSPTSTPAASLSTVGRARTATDPLGVTGRPVRTARGGVARRPRPRAPRSGFRSSDPDWRIGQRSTSRPGSTTVIGPLVPPAW